MTSVKEKSYFTKAYKIVFPPTESLTEKLDSANIRFNVLTEDPQFTSVKIETDLPAKLLGKLLYSQNIKYNKIRPFNSNAEAQKNVSDRSSSSGEHEKPSLTKRILICDVFNANSLSDAIRNRLEKRNGLKIKSIESYEINPTIKAFVFNIKLQAENYAEMYNLQLSDILGQFRKDCQPKWWSKSAAQKLSKLKRLKVDQGGRSSAKKKPNNWKSKTPSQPNKPKDHGNNPPYGRFNNMITHPVSYNYGYGYYPGVPYGVWPGSEGGSCGSWYS